MPLSSLLPCHLAKCLPSRGMPSHGEWVRGLQENHAQTLRHQVETDGGAERFSWDSRKVGDVEMVLWSSPLEWDLKQAFKEGWRDLLGFSFFPSWMSHSSIHQPLDTGLSFPPPPFLPGFLPGLFLSSCLETFIPLTSQRGEGRCSSPFTSPLEEFYYKDEGYIH